MLNINYQKFVSFIKNAKSIAIIGNGGNMAVAEHAASDMSRYLQKFCFAPTAIHLTALGGDENWHQKWVDYAALNADLIIGITTRINSPISNALENIENINRFLIAPKRHSTVPTLLIQKNQCHRIDFTTDELTFHEFEVEVLWQFYMFFRECGAELNTI
jgi:hypothetical protein